MVDDAERMVLLGRIGAAQGLRGEVRITAFTGQPEDVAQYGPLSDKTGTKCYQILRVRHSKPPQIIAKLSGVDDRTAAEALNGVELYVSRDRLPEAGADEFYHADLVGMQAVAPGGTPAGEVVAVHNFGAGDLIEIRHPGAKHTELYPFTAQTVPHIDTLRRELTLVIPETI